MLESLKLIIEHWHLKRITAATCAGGTSGAPTVRTIYTQNFLSALANQQVIYDTD
jgi:hypothetical protein